MLSFQIPLKHPSSSSQSKYQSVPFPTSQKSHHLLFHLCMSCKCWGKSKFCYSTVQNTSIAELSNSGKEWMKLTQRIAGLSKLAPLPYRGPCFLLQERVLRSRSLPWRSPQNDLMFDLILGKYHKVWELYTATAFYLGCVENYIPLGGMGPEVKKVSAGGTSFSPLSTQDAEGGTGASGQRSELITCRGCLTWRQGPQISQPNSQCTF